MVGRSILLSEHNDVRVLAIICIEVGDVTVVQDFIHREITRSSYSVILVIQDQVEFIYVSQVFKKFVFSYII